VAVRYNLARRHARELLARGEVIQPPVPVDLLARLVGAKIRYEQFDGDGDVSGLVRRRPDGSAIIGVNAANSLRRQRFTIAHEVGHLLLHLDEDFHIDERFPIGFRSEVSSLAVDPREIEANQFAAELLMPASFLRADLLGRSFDIESDDALDELATRYEVSLQAMAIRLSSLRLVR
jgi:Zn-dependent peptidase ImmA (M78 family)